MAQIQGRTSKSHKIEDARDLQAKLYREIGISAVAAALRFTSLPDPVPTGHGAASPGTARASHLAA